MGKKHGKKQWDGEEDHLRGQGMPDAAQEDLNEYIRVASPGTIIVILSLLILLVSTILWGFIGTLPVTETVTGLVVDTTLYRKLYPEKAEVLPDGRGEILVLCFVDASRYNGQAIKAFGDEAALRMPDQNTFTGTIETRFQAPVSMEQAKNILFENEWVLSRCVSQDYNWFLVIRPEEDLSQYAFTLAKVTIVTEEVAPIRLLMR